VTRRRADRETLRTRSASTRPVQEEAHSILTSSSEDFARRLAAQEPSPEEMRHWEHRWVQGGVRRGRTATAAASQSIQRSREHIVGSDEVRARWLLDFAFRDLKLLSPGDWLNLFTELQAFLSSRGFVYGRIAHDEIERAVLEPEVRRVQKWLRSSLMRLVLNEGSTWRIEPKVSFNFIFHRDQGLTDWSFPGGASAVQDLFRFRAYETLRSQAHRFRSCLECRRPFIVRKRQEYCSVRCSQTLRTRKFRSKRPKRKRS